MIEFTVKYLAKYRLKNNQHYIFSNCGLCFNKKSGKLVKQITKKYTIGYLIDGKFIKVDHFDFFFEIKKGSEIDNEEKLKRAKNAFFSQFGLGLKIRRV